MTKDEMIADIAAVLKEDASELVHDDNLVDYGLDSIRLMTLVQKWNDSGYDLKFADLAERPEIDHWWSIVSVRRNLPAN